MNPKLLHRCLQEQAEKPLKLKINDNRSTMLSVRWEPDHTRVSLHRMFLQAPDEVMKALAQYIRTKESKLAPSIKIFIEEKMASLDYSHLVTSSELSPQGDVYDLQAIYHELNEKYFHSELNLHITWFGKKGKRYRSRLNLGLYHEITKMVKINRVLDNKQYPDYLIRFVIYHEMLHSVCPGYVDHKGISHIHTPEFCRREKEFEDYHLAQEWIQGNIEQLFQEV